MVPRNGYSAGIVGLRMSYRGTIEGPLPTTYITYLYLARGKTTNIIDDKNVTDYSNIAAASPATDLLGQGVEYFVAELYMVCTKYDIIRCL